MITYITSQSLLAEAVGVSPQWLSTIKRYYSASDELLIKLEKLTGIPQVYWVSSKRKHLLDKKLEVFLNQEKERADRARILI